MQTLWVARDEDGSLYLYFNEKPLLDKHGDEPRTFYDASDPIDNRRFRRLDNDFYPEVTFQNSPQKLMPETLRKSNQ